MPPAPGNGRLGPRKPKPKPKYTVAVPDAKEETRSRQPTIPTPDQADRNRSAPQKVRDRAAVAETLRRTRSMPKAKPPAMIVAGGGKARTTGPVGYVPAIARLHAASQQQRAARLAPALVILDQLGRPVHAEAAATRAAIRGDNVLKAAGRGLANKDKSTFSDVLGDLGVHNKVAKAVGGFALDVAADPTTYLSFGVSSTARHAAESAARKATKQALKQGASKKAADKAGRAAARAALDKGPGKGLTVGALGKRTSGRTTARISKTLRVPRGSEKLRGALPGRLLRHVAPTVRPAGVSEQDFLKVRDAMTKGRAITAVGEKNVRNQAQAIARVLPGDAHPQITDALESRSLAGLTDDEAKVARALAHSYDQMHAVEHAHGLVGPKFKEFGYSPRHAVSELEPTGSKRRPSGAQLASSKARTNRRARADFRGGPDDIYTENAALGYYLRGRDSAVKIGRKVVIDALHGVSSRWHPGVALKDGEEIYKFTPTGAPVRVQGDELKALAAGHQPLPTVTTEDEIKQAVERRAAVEQIRERLARAEASENAARNKVTRLAQKHKSDRAKEGHNQQIAAYYVGAQRFELHSEAVAAHRAAQDAGIHVGEIRRVALTSGEAKRVGELSAARNNAEAIAKRRRALQQDLRVASQRTSTTTEYRVLHSNLVKVAEQGVPERLDGLEELGRLWDRQIQGRVKTVLTVVNPQYHMTNLYGDLFNAYKAAPAWGLARDLGISARALTYRARREAAAKTLGKQIAPSGKAVSVGGGRKTLDELIKEAEDHGAINQGFIGRDLAEVLDRQGKEAAQRLGQGKLASKTRVGQKIATSRVGSKIAHPIDTVRNASQYREDAVRLALYLGRRRGGDTPAEAARFTNRHLFDYGDLTQFEKSVLRRVLPFYTFTARNTPQQVRALLERPGKYATLEKAREEGQKASSVPAGYEGDLEHYEQQGIPIPIPGTSNLLYPKLPATDLGRLTVKDQGNYLMAMLTPLIKSPIELDQNYSFFLRRKIDELSGTKGPNGESVNQLKPAPPVLLSALKLAGPLRGELTKALQLQQYTDKRTGKKVIGWPAKVDYVWRMTPATTFAGQAGSQIPNTRGQSPGQATFGYTTGLKVVPFSPPEVKQKRAGEAYGYLTAKAKSMRDRGTAYDAKGDRTPAYQKVLDQTRAAYAVIDPNPPKRRASNLSPEAAAALEGIRASAGKSTGLSSDAQAVLESLRKP